MRGINKQELKDILDKHSKWLRHEEGGERANLSDTNLRYANLRYADLRYANLRSANLSSADLRYADLRSADLSDTNLRCANLSCADLSCADLRCADLRSADLSDTNLRYTRLENKVLLTFCFGKHTASFMSEDSITIGCYTHPTAYWVEHFVTIGTQEGYTTAQIQEYGRFIKGCAKIQASMPKESK